MLRSKMLRENGQYIPQAAFDMRRNYLLDKDSPIVKGKDKPGQVFEIMLLVLISVYLPYWY